MKRLYFIFAVLLGLNSSLAKADILFCTPCMMKTGGLGYAYIMYFGYYPPQEIGGHGEFRTWEQCRANQQNPPPCPVIRNVPYASDSPDALSEEMILERHRPE